MNSRQRRARDREIERILEADLAKRHADFYATQAKHEKLMEKADYWVEKYEVKKHEVQKLIDSDILMAPFVIHDVSETSNNWLMRFDSGTVAYYIPRDDGLCPKCTTGTVIDRPEEPWASVKVCSVGCGYAVYSSVVAAPDSKATWCGDPVHVDQPHFGYDPNHPLLKKD